MLLWLGQLSAFATHSLSLAWNPSPDVNVVAYKIYFGGASNAYTNSFNTGSATNVTVFGLTGGATYYFSATSISDSGVESIFSNEATYVIPADSTPVQPPTINGIQNLTIYKNSGMQTVNLTGIGVGSGGNPTVTITAVSGNTTVIPTPTVIYAGSSSSGSITFTPVANALGSALVTITVNNGAASNNITTQSFTVTVVPPPVVAPTINGIQNLTIYKNSGLQTVALAGIGAGSGANPTVTITAVSGNTAVISPPTVNYTSSSSTGTITFTPVTNALGSALMTVTVNNGGATNNLTSQSFTVTVIAPPIVAPTLSAITNLTIYKNSGLQTVALAGIGAGSGANPTVTITAVSGNTAVIPTPTIHYTSSSSTGTITFTPVANALGSALVTVTVNNGGATNNLISQSFTVTVIAPPVVAPTLNAISDLTIYKNSGLQTIALAGIGAGSGANPTVTITAVSGNTAVIPTPTIHYTNSSSTGTITFTPVANALGSALVTVTVNNGGATNNLTSQSFTVTVTAPPVVAPTLNAISDLTIYKNSGMQTIALAGIGAGSGANPTVTITAVSGNTSVIPTPTIHYTSSSSTGTITFTPVTNAVGLALVTVTVNNGGTTNNLISQSFNVTVIAPPVVAPTLNAISDLTVYKNSGMQTVALAGIGAGSGGNPTVTITAVSDNTEVIPTPTIHYTNSNSTGTLTFTPATNALGSALVTVTVNNGGATNNVISQSFTVTVAAPVPIQPPTLDAFTNLTVYKNSGMQTVALTGIGPGAGGNSTVIVTATSANITAIPTPTVHYTNLSSTGTITFTPMPNVLGAATVTVTVNNGAPSNNVISRAFTVSVVAPPPPHAPTINALTNLTIYKNSGLQTVALTGIGAGYGGNPTVTITAVSGNLLTIPTPTVNYTNSNSTGTLTFMPVTDALGTATVTVTVNNGAASNNISSQSFTVTVITPPVVVQPPTLNAITNLTIYKNSGPQTVALAGIGAGSGGNPTVTVTAVSDNTALVPIPTVNYTNSNSTGTLTFTSAAGALGTATLTVTVDNGAASNNLVSQSFTVTVVPVPGITQTPTLDTITNLTIYQGSGLTTVDLTGISPGTTPPQPVVITATSSNPELIPTPTITYTNPSSLGSLAFAPVTNALGSAIVTVTVDNGGTSNNITTRTFMVTVVVPPGGNQPPTLNSITNLTVIQGTISWNLNLTGITSGSPTEKQVLRVSATSSNPTLIPTPTIRYINPATTAVLVFSPKPTALGVTTITVTVNDGGKSNNIVRQSFTITVVSNQPPTLAPIADVTVAKNVPSQNITLTGISCGPVSENQSLTITAVSSNPRLVPTPTIHYTNHADTAVLTFKPAANLTGSTLITVTVNDGGKSNNLVRQVFTVNVVTPSTNSSAVTGTIPNTEATLTTVVSSAGQFSFQVTGTAGVKYAVQTTSDLVHWTSVQTNTAPYTYTDSTVNGSSRRFYRAQYIP